MSGYRETLRNLNWYSPATPYLLAHMRARSKRIQKAYTALAQTTPVENPLHAWLIQRIAALELFVKSLSLIPEEVQPALWLGRKTPGLALALIPFLGIPVAVTGFSALILRLVDACYCKLVRIVPAAVFVGAAIAIAGFFIKRDVLLGSASSRKAGSKSREQGDNLYELEHRLLRAVGGRPKGESQLDVPILFALGVFVFFWDNIAEAFAGSHELVSLVSSRYLGLAVFVVAVVVLIRSIRRPWAWRA